MGAFKRPQAPLPLVAMALVYLATEFVQLGSRPPKMIVARIVVYAVVFLAALYGSLIAAVLWGIVSTLAAGAGFYALWHIVGEGLAKHLADDGQAIALIAFQTVFFSASATYIFRSKALKAYQQSQRRAVEERKAKAALHAPRDEAPPQSDRKDD